MVYEIREIGVKNNGVKQIGVKKFGVKKGTPHISSKP